MAPLDEVPRGPRITLGACGWRTARRTGRDSNPRYGLSRLHALQACAFNHSATCPDSLRGRNLAATPGPVNAVEEVPAVSSDASIDRSTYYVQAGLKCSF